MYKLTIVILSALFITNCSTTLNNQTSNATKVDWLFVQVAEKSKMVNASTLQLVSKNKVFAFQDRPYRHFIHLSRKDFVSLWDDGMGFNMDPPNAVLTWDTKDGVSEALVELVSAKISNNGHGITYKIKVTTGTIPKNIGESSLFIDDFGSAVGGWFVARGNDLYKKAPTIAEGLGGLAVGQRKAIVSGIKNAATKVGNTLKKTADAANQGGTDVALEAGADGETAAAVGEVVEVGAAAGELAM